MKLEEIKLRSFEDRLKKYVADQLLADEIALDRIEAVTKSFAQHAMRQSIEFRKYGYLNLKAAIREIILGQLNKS